MFRNIGLVTELHAGEIEPEIRAVCDRVLSVEAAESAKTFILQLCNILDSLMGDYAIYVVSRDREI